MEEVKKYIFQEKEFTLKPITLDLLSKTFQLDKRWKKCVSEYSKKSWDNAKNIINELANKKKNKKTEKFIEELDECLKTENSDIILKKLSEIKYDDNNDLVKIKDIIINITFEWCDALEQFLLGENDLKELFELVLDGEVKEIDYSVDTAKKRKELKEFSIQVFTDFFLK